MGPVDFQSNYVSVVFFVFDGALSIIIFFSDFVTVFENLMGVR